VGDEDSREHPRSDGTSPVAIVLAACALLLIGGFLLKGQCLTGRFTENAYQDLCYNDLQPLFGLRLFRETEAGPQRVFPYIHGELADGELRDGAIEYPVLTGVFMYVSSFPADDTDTYLRVSGFFLAPFALVVAYLLFRLSRYRALLWALAPALAFYAFHNWDLLVVAAAVVGLWLWSRGTPLWAAVAFGVGASFKMYPIFFLAPLALDALRRAGSKEALRLLGAGVGTFALINLPFVIANFDGWLATYSFHSQRGPNFETIWYFGRPSWGPSRINLVSALLTAAFFLGILAYGWIRSRGEKGYPVLQTSAGLLAAFMLWNKVHSPQYTLWLLPFFALLVVNVGWWVSYTLADAAVYMGVFRWFHEIGQGRDMSNAKRLLIAGTWVRAALLLLLVGVFLRSRRAEAEVAEDVAPSLYL
jgi:uncharacterized membrane protein